MEFGTVFPGLGEDELLMVNQQIVFVTCLVGRSEREGFLHLFEK